MSLTDIFLIVFIFFLVACVIYAELVIDKSKGKTQLRVKCLRQGKADPLIFIGLLAILLYNKINNQSTSLTNYLLTTLALIVVYFSLIRWPKILFKPTGFYYANVFISYDRMQAINLSEDGILVIQLEHKKLFIRVKNLDDLDNIYQVMLSNQVDKENCLHSDVSS